MIVPFFIWCRQTYCLEGSLHVFTQHWILLTCTNFKRCHCSIGYTNTDHANYGIFCTEGYETWRDSWTFECHWRNGQSKCLQYWSENCIICKCMVHKIHNLYTYKITSLNNFPLPLPTALHSYDSCHLSGYFGSILMWHFSLQD